MHEGLPPADELPWTISWAVRKMLQIEQINELPSEKRPPDSILWDGTQEDINVWFDKVFKTKGKQRPDELVLMISEDDIEK